MLRIVTSVSETSAVAGEYLCLLDELAREGACRILSEALVLEADAYVVAARSARDEAGHALVARNGYARERQVVTGAGSISVRAPRVNDKRKGQRFRSSILPPYMRKSPKVTELLPVLYLHGLSSNDMKPALEQFLGTAAGLSASVVTRLAADWQDEHKAWQRRSLADKRYVYVWVDGIHFNVRLGGDEKLCCLVMIGATETGTKELIAIQAGYRESTESWADVLRDLKRQGMQPPMVAVGDGALGFWSAVRDVWPETRPQRDWVHKVANIVNVLPKALHARARGALREIYEAENKPAARTAMQAFIDEFGVKWPKAADKLAKDADALLTFFDFPAEHWRHLRTSNPIESTFAPVRARTNTTKGPGSREQGLAMVYKLVDNAQHRSWHKLNGAHQLPLVAQGIKFENGVQQVTTNITKDAA